VCSSDLQQKNYKSKYYDDVVNGKMTYDEFVKKGDFVFNADVTSLYPASMKGTDFLKCLYPTGKSRWSDTPYEEFQNNKYGFYHIQYSVPDKKIRVPVLPKAKYNGENKIGVEWSLEDGEGIYPYIDILNAVESGYEITFLNKCLVYDSVDDVFGKYIDKFFELKDKADKEVNNVLRSFAKLMLNSLYGKQLQKANFETTSIVNDILEFNRFVYEYDLIDYDYIHDNKLLVKGSKKNKESCINKAPQLGAFITAYSRRIMLYYMKLIDPSLKSLIFTYTDTDSLHIKAEHYFKLKEMGYVDTGKIGYLSNDTEIKENGKKYPGMIIKENNLGPKSYMYESVHINGALKINDIATMKYKGIPKQFLKHEYYENETRETIEMNGRLKKVGTKINNPQKENDLTYFDVYNIDMKRTFNKNDWEGFKLVDNEFYPKGYMFDN